MFYDNILFCCEKEFYSYIYLMKNILFVAPEHNMGGIFSWAQVFRTKFPQSDYQFYCVNNAPVRGKKTSLCGRILTGLVALFRVRRDIKSIFEHTHIDMMHATTSGSIGALRDWYIGRMCKKRNIKTILHCHYGCIPQIMSKRSLIWWGTLLSMMQYDQIWVLDTKSYESLTKIKPLQNQIRLAPNGIEVKMREAEILPKRYTQVAFVGNLLPSKGVCELVSAMALVNENISLHLVGGGESDVIANIETIAGPFWGTRIKYHGELSNKEAIEFMNRMDIVALPTYYQSEAFPISILEAMSLGKLVISTRRAAIPDMLMGKDGSMCGILVDERNVTQLAEAINWCYENPRKADKICENAFQKVRQAYDLHVVYEIYRKNYRDLLANE